MTRSRLAAAARRATPAVVQPMERRVLMSAAMLANGVLTVTGTAGADTIYVTQQNPQDYLVTVNGVSQEFTGTPAATLTQIVISAGDGNDTVGVNDTFDLGTAGPTVSVSGGAGDDTLSAYGDAPTTLDGGDGNDTISGGSYGALPVTMLGGAGNDSFEFGDDVQASVNGGDGNDTLTIDDFGASEGVTFFGGAGTDTLNIAVPIGANTINLDGLPNSTVSGAYTSTFGADIENVIVGAPGGPNQVGKVVVSGDALDNQVTVYGYLSGVTVHGGDGNDLIDVMGGQNDALYGDGGNDTIVGGTSGLGVTTISGGAGIDTVDYSAQTVGRSVYLDGSQLSGTAGVADGYGDLFDGTVEVVDGGSGNDLLVAAPGGGDALFGNGGNDTLVAQGGADALFLGDGNDTFQAADGSATYVDGGAGTDTATIDVTGDTTLNVETITKAAAPAAVLSNGVLTVTGTAGADTISVGGGIGDGGMAGFGNNTYYATATVNGVTQTFTGITLTEIVVNAGDGNDTVTAGTSQVDGSISMVVNGGAGNDSIGFDGDAAATVYGGDGNDAISGGDLYGDGKFVLSGEAGNDTLTADNNYFTTVTGLYGGDGNDTLINFDPLDTSLLVSGGAGTDTYELGNTAGLSVGYIDMNAAVTTVPALPGAVGVESDVENLTINDGSFPGGLTVLGNNADNVIDVTATFGPVSVFGGGGNDTITAYGGGKVLVSGDAGNDTLTAGSNGPPGQTGLVTLSGGAGTDLVDLSASTEPLTVYLDGSKPSGTAAQIADGDGLIFDGTVEQVAGGSANDLIYAAPGGGDALYGNGGNDTLVAQGGADALFGGDGNDVLSATYGGGSYIDGGPGTDTAYVEATGDTTLNVETVIFPTGTAARYAGTTSGTAGSNQNGGNTVAKATDGDLATYFDGPTANGDRVVVDLGASKVVSQIRFAPRPGFANRMVGGYFEGSNKPDFSAGTTTYYTLTAAPIDGVLTAVSPLYTAPSRYWAYVAPNGSYGNIAEFELFGTATPTPTPTPTQLTGTTYGTAGSYANGGNTIAKATDGSLTTFFDAPTASGATVDLDLGSAKTVAQIKYAPRSGWAARMVGGVFQASNSATFATGVVTVFTVTATPTVGVLTTATPSTTAAYRYWRYVGPTNSYCDIAEFQLFGTATATPVTQRTGTTIGTAGSYANGGNTIAKATDGNLSTYFDGPTASGDWVGLDLGSATTVSQIKYAPRTGWTPRMVGGIFQASNSATFSTGVVNLYTVTTAPVAGSLTTVSLASPATYRYFRYLAPANSYGDLAEFQLFG